MQRRSGTRAGVFGLSVVLLILALASTTDAANSSKPYSVVICGGGQTGCSPSNPAVAAPGGTAANPSTLSVTFTNKNKVGSGIQIGSDNLNVPSAPAGFAVVGTSLTACPTSQQGPPCAYLLNGGTTVGFRNLDIPTGAPPMTITLYAITPPPSTTACTTASPCLWSDVAKQSNDFSGTGNNLNADATSSYGTVTSAVASCPKKQGCATNLANGGTDTSAPGSINVKVNTSSGKTAVTQIESIDFGGTLACSGLSSPHLVYENLSNGADNGADRSQTITINTTDFSGYVPEFCLETTKPFTQLVFSAPLPDGTPVGLAPANATTLPDGSPGYQGLLPDCGNSPLQPLQVDCSKTPGVLSRQTVGKLHTIVAAIPPGFDLRASN